MQTDKYLGPYKLGEVLGRGGMGTVYSALHAKSGEQVAVKLIAASVSDEMRFRRRFEAEVETLKLLRHDNIVQLIGYGEEQGQLFYSMELVLGESLHQRIRREKKLDWMTVIDIGIDVCSALKHAHDLGVYHRDLKPANLIITNDNKTKLVDFGIAKTFGFSDQTAAGSVLGTADYMAPEQATGRGVTQRTDLYALGSVMYAMLAGRPPFRGKNITEVIDALKRDNPAPLDMIDPELPDDIVALIHQLLSKDPDDRPPTALAVMNRLKAMRAGLRRNLTEVGNRPSDSTQVDGQKTDDASQKTIQPSVSPSAHTVFDPGAAPRDKTVADPATNKTAVHAQQADVEETASSSRTHFQTVDDKAESRSIFQTKDSEAASGVSQWLSVSAMVTALIFGLIVLGIALRNANPSADDIYARIVQQRDSGKIKQAVSDMEKFEKLFPDDPRIEEVTYLHHVADLNGLVHHLRVQVAPLKEHEKRFLEAIDLRPEDADGAAEKLAAWGRVFVDSEKADVSEARKRMRALADKEADILQTVGYIGDELTEGKACAAESVMSWLCPATSRNKR